MNRAVAGRADRDDERATKADEQAIKTDEPDHGRRGRADGRPRSVGVGRR